MPASFLSTLTGSFSTPAGENPTVAMMEAAYAHHGVDARYLNCEVGPAGLADAVRGAVAMGWVGFNCSLPHKVAVVALLDRLADSARVIGAVNCVVRRGEDLVGENTDGQGFLASLRTVAEPQGAHVVVLGAGGAARAIAVELALAGAAQVSIVNRSADKAAELARLVAGGASGTMTQSTGWSGAYAVPAGTQVLVNATSIGLHPDPATPDVDPDSLRPGLVVADVIPNPPHTRFLATAAAQGCTTLDGLGMLVEQGAVAIRHWLDLDPDRAVMRARLTEVIG